MSEGEGNSFATWPRVPEWETSTDFFCFCGMSNPPPPAHKSYFLRQLYFVSDSGEYTWLEGWHKPQRAWHNHQVGRVLEVLSSYLSCQDRAVLGVFYLLYNIYKFCSFVNARWRARPVPELYTWGTIPTLVILGVAGTIILKLD